MKQQENIGDTEKSLPRKLGKKDVNLFLGIMIISLIGNACADYALMWHGISLIHPNATGAKDTTLTSFYVGQAVGILLLSPLLAVVFDRFTRFASSVALDLLYAGFLVLMGAFYKFGILSPQMIFIFSSLTAGIAILHKSSVGFAAIQKMSETSGITNVTAKFMAALNIPFLFGSLLSGFVFQYVGFNGCMAIGVLTFLPMPFVYWRVFKGEEPVKRGKAFTFFSDLREGMSVLAKDPLLIGTASSISVLNIASAVLPGIVGIAFTTRYAGRTDYASIAISLSIFAGILFTKRIGEMAKNWSTQRVIPLSVLPATIALAVCFIFPHPVVYGVMFLLSCVGSAARNVTSGSLRVARVPKGLIGRVNTVYTALLSLGQTLGGFVIIQAVQKDMQSATIVIIACFVLASIISFAMLPKDPVAKFVEAKS